MNMKDKFKAAFEAGVLYQSSMKDKDKVTQRPDFEDWYSNHFPKDKRPLWLIIITRVLGLIPFMILGTIAFFVLLIQYGHGFIMYGGESIAYSRKSRPTMIHDIFIKLQKDGCK